MSKIITLPVELVQELFEHRHDEGPHEWVSDNQTPETLWRFVATQWQDSGRWEERWMFVVEKDSGPLYGIDYKLGLTENQPNTLPWQPGPWALREPTTVDAFQVQATQMTVIRYRRT